MRLHMYGPSTEVIAEVDERLLRETVEHFAPHLKLYNMESVTPMEPIRSKDGVLLWPEVYKDHIYLEVRLGHVRPGATVYFDREGNAS